MTVSGAWNTSHSILCPGCFPCEVGKGGDRGRWAIFKAPLAQAKFRLLKTIGGPSGVSSELPHQHTDPRREGTVCLLTRCDSKQPMASGTCRPCCVDVTSVHCILLKWLRNKETWKRAEYGHLEAKGPSCQASLPTALPQRAGGDTGGGSQGGWL